MSASKKFPGLPSGWTEKIEKVEADLNIRIWKNSNSVTNASLFIVHGQAEQSSRYLHFPNYLRSQVSSIYAIDLPGHGLSSGIRGHIENFDQYTKACLKGFEYMKSNETGKIFHWFGHSLGGLISLKTLHTHKDLPLSSVTVSAPLLDLAFPVPKVKKFFGELVEPLLGSINLSNELDPSMVSHDPDVDSEYVSDKLNHNLVTPRFFVNMMKESTAIRNNFSEFNYNLMAILPQDDKIVSWQASLEYFQKLPMAKEKKKEIQLFPGFYHESFNEIGKERAFVALQRWIGSNN